MVARLWHVHVAGDRDFVAHLYASVNRQNTDAAVETPVNNGWNSWQYPEYSINTFFGLSWKYIRTCNLVFLFLLCATI